MRVFARYRLTRLHVVNSLTTTAVMGDRRKVKKTNRYGEWKEDMKFPGGKLKEVIYFVSKYYLKIWTTFVKI